MIFSDSAQLEFDSLLFAKIYIYIVKRKIFSKNLYGNIQKLWRIQLYKMIIKNKIYDDC